MGRVFLHSCREFLSIFLQLQRPPEAQLPFTHLPTSSYSPGHGFCLGAGGSQFLPWWGPLYLPGGGGGVAVSCCSLVLTVASPGPLPAPSCPLSGRLGMLGKEPRAGQSQGLQH